MLCTENCLAFLHYRCSLLERTEYLWWEQQTGHRSLMMLFSGIRIFSLIWVWSYHVCYEQQVLLLSVLIINFLLIRQSCLARINYLASQGCLSSLLRHVCTSTIVLELSKAAVPLKTKSVFYNSCISHTAFYFELKEENRWMKSSTYSLWIFDFWCSLQLKILL